VSSDHGTTFSPSKALEGDVIIGNPIPDIAIAGDRDVHVIWQSNVYPGPIGNSSSTNGTDYDFRTHLFFTASHDNGQKFGPLKRLDGAGDYTFNSRIAADGNNVFVVWQNVSAFWTPSGSEILLKSSDDKGASFGSTVIIDDDTGDSLGFVRPDVAADGRRLYVSWWQSDSLDAAPDVYIQRGMIHSN